MSAAIKLVEKCNMPKFMHDTQPCKAALERFSHAARADALSEAAEEAPLNSDAECVIDMAEREGK